jgi:hypothetical protein
MDRVPRPFQDVPTEFNRQFVVIGNDPFCQPSKQFLTLLVVSFDSVGNVF